jgi:uncharacterized cysteine cluster protein YcgN (CxxCxxCC family)
MTDNHEDKCLRCGRCCYKKVMLNGVAYFTNVPCRHLDTEKKTCRKYDVRYKIPDGCIPWEQAIKIAALPQDCPYVQGIKDYQGPKPFEQLAVIMSLMQTPPKK